MKYKGIFFLMTLVVFSINLPAMPPETEEDKIIIAVVDFRNTGGSENLNYLEKTIPENIITRMAKSGRTEIVERARLQDALKEMELGIAGIIDEQSAVELGRAVGANAILLGSFASIGQKIRINARLIEVSTSRIIKAEVVQGNVSSEIFQLMDQLAISMEQQLLRKDGGTVQYQPIPISESQPPEKKIKKKRSVFKSPVFWTAVAVGAGGGAYYYTQMSPEEKEKLTSLTIFINIP